MIYAILQFIIYCEDKHWLEKNDSTCIKLYFLMVGLFNLATVCHAGVNCLTLCSVYTEEFTA